MRNWKAAGILAYTVDARGLYVLLGKLEPGAAVQQGSSRYREGWWILGEPLLPKPGQSPLLPKPGRPPLLPMPGRSPLLPMPGRLLCCCHPGCACAGRSHLLGAPVHSG